MTGNVLVLLAAYLLGSLPTAVVVARRQGAGDIRDRGSGNPGATNVFRVLGPGPALLVLIADLAKGAIAAGWLPALAGPTGWLPFAAGGAAVAGHLWPVWTRLRGGKGVATTAGVVLVLMPWVGVALVIVFAVVLIWTRKVAAAALAAVIGLVPAVLLVGTDSRSTEIGFALLVTLLVVAAHRDNIGRLLSGKEPKLQWKR